MNAAMNRLLSDIKGHRCYNHPIFQHWTEVPPAPTTVGALFHQIQNFCASTRPGWNFSLGLRENGMEKQGQLMDEIVASESSHGPELATMAGYIVNRAAQKPVCPDLKNQDAVEDQLRQHSDELLGRLPGYDAKTGLTEQTRRAIAVFERRKLTDRESTLRNLGSALALEMISNGQLIPGEKQCLIDSGHYGATLEDPEMHYLLEHYGEIGAEQQHEKNAINAVGDVLSPKTKDLIERGAADFLNSLVSLWDVLDSALLASGYRLDPVAKAV
jgi:hypothetical protein